MNGKKTVSVLLAFTLISGLVGGSGSLLAAAYAAPDVPQFHDGNNYYADFDTAEEAYEAGDEVNKEILSEGITMLKNEGSMPLAAGAKVSVFGNRSANLRYGGSGSGSGSGGSRITVKDSLERAGFKVNPSLWNFYADNNRSGTPGGNLSSYGVFAGPSNGFNETPVPTLQANVNESTYTEYGAAALIIFSRAGGEAGDATKGMATGYSKGVLNGTKVSGARNYDDHYLQLDENETALIKYVGDRFDNVIVILNTGSQMEVGFLDDPNHYAYHENLKGALWIGYPGNGNGLEALGEILAGKTNPSGRTVDTYARDFKKDPTWGNMPTYTDNLYRYSNYSSRQFAMYDEGIYSGYRYYETRGYVEGDGEWSGELHGTTTSSWDSWYAGNVVYPFGYGLSYTSFSWEFAEEDEETVLHGDDVLTLSVKVTNTGEMAGKDVVELYYTAPYYSGQIEKSHVLLGDYAKTKLLLPGESETVTLKLSARDMASYDYNDANQNGFCGYELDGGDYVLKVSRNAHEPVLTKTYSLEEGCTYATSGTTEQTVGNRFEESYNGFTVLSRADFEGTFPKEPTSEERICPQEVQTAVTNSSDDTAILAQDTDDKPYYTDEMPVTGAKNGVMLEDLYGLPFDDPLWESFLDQLTVGGRDIVNSMAHILWLSGWTSYGIPDLGIPEMHHEDGPSGIAGKNVKGNYTNFASETVTASTWNRELAHEKGIIIGNQGLFANTSQVNALYAPACNIHRSPFGGRNFEYFSEDALLSGEMAGNIVKGCNEKGMVTFVKHFAANDQESCRDNLLTWVDEQTLREIYLEPFRICVEKYSSHGIMSGLNSLGAVWAGGNYALLTEVLRGEWGFDGVVITDYVQSRKQLNGNMAIRAGGDILLATSGTSQAPVGLDRATTVSCMRRAMHDLCYTVVNFTAAFNRERKNVLGAYEGGTLTPAVGSFPYEQSVATVPLNNGGSPSEVRYSLKEGSTLPQGLTLSEDGLISGTAALQTEAAEFTVEARYGFAKREATFTLPVVDSERSVIYVREQERIEGSLKDGLYADIAWAYTVDHKKHSFRYLLDEGSVLPEGLTLSESGVLSGKPKLPFKDYPIVVRAESDGMLPMSVRLLLSVYEGIAVYGETLPSARIGTPYAVELSDAADGAANFALKLGSSLPQGMTLTSGGALTGIPQEAGRWSFTVVVSGENIRTEEYGFTFFVDLRYAPSSLSEASEGQKYEQYINFAQGGTDIRYTLAEGSLPRGMTLSRDGVLRGTPLENGDFTFTVAAHSGDLSDSATLTLRVAPKENHAAYIAGLSIGIAGVVLVAAAMLLYLFVFAPKAAKADGHDSPDGGGTAGGEAAERPSAGETPAGSPTGKGRGNGSFIKISSAILAVLVATVVGLGVAMYPAQSAGSELQTYTFEAEYVYLDEFMGAGISNSGVGVDNIYEYTSDEESPSGCSNGYFLGNTYAMNTITFEIASDTATNGKLILRLASELGNLALNGEVFGISVNGVEVDYSITVAGSAPRTYEFADYPITASIGLKAGVNTVSLTIKDNKLKDGNSIGAPFIDCIRISASAKLTWSPLTDNPSRRGQA